MKSSKNTKNKKTPTSLIDESSYPKSSYPITKELDIYKEYTPQKVDTSLILPEPLSRDTSQTNMFSSSFQHMGNADGSSQTLPEWLI